MIKLSLKLFIFKSRMTLFRTPFWFDQLLGLSSLLDSWRVRELLFSYCHVFVLAVYHYCLFIFLIIFFSLLNRLDQSWRIKDCIFLSIMHYRGVQFANVVNQLMLKLYDYVMLLQNFSKSLCCFYFLKNSYFWIELYHLLV